MFLTADKEVEPHENCSLHGSGSGGVLPLITSPRNSRNEDDIAGSCLLHAHMQPPFSY